MDTNNKINETLDNVLAKVQQLVNDEAPRFLQRGYLFAGEVRRKAGLNQDSEQPVRFNLLGKDTLLVRGAEGVRAFYDQTLVDRAGAMPKFISGPLFGEGAVHGLDGEQHAHRKQAMAALAYDDERVAAFKLVVAEEMDRMLQQWREREGNIYDDVAIVYGRAAFRWAGIPLDDEEMAERAEQMSRLLDTFGTPATNPISWLERKRLDDWSADLITRVRNGSLTVDPNSVIAQVAKLDDVSGELLPAKTAGIELQNLTRPTVAVARFAAFAAAELVQHQDWIERIRTAGEQDSPEAVAFAQEIRRTKPFVPMLPALVKRDGEISGCPVHKGQRLLIDILGTNTGPTWDRPGTFDPERFLGVDGESIDTFIPQGGADVFTGHRCPGEKIAVTALATTINALCRPEVRISDDQVDTAFSWTKMLTRPETGVRVSVAG
ncbi:cytochrome P450 [Corynebacterium epidermidicanis]|uniref:Cytochrome P450 n=1 Tax=Corynebacterium epidermidicanis TaxID=1050174 RepID=A0A0G3GLG7_9CORY|nr:cytochrome P450 [Corynebacterium epidermidicanis]AKK02009.1 cytochrome P450 [Corynebacterium epidermidicanis]